MNSSSLKNKLQSNKGATIVFALFALLVGVMISAVVIYTAFSNVGRVKKTQSDEQNYLSVSSAVRLFKDSLEGDSVSYVETLISETKITCDNNWEPVEPPSVETTLTTTSEDAVYHDVALPLRDGMLTDVLNVWAKEIDSPASKELTITITGDSNLSNIAPVEAEMIFDSVNKKMTITFRAKEEPPSAADKYSTVMTMDLSKSTSYPVTSSMEEKKHLEGNNVKIITVEKTVVHTIRWENCVITKKK